MIVELFCRMWLMIVFFMCGYIDLVILVYLVFFVWSLVFVLDVVLGGGGGLVMLFIGMMMLSLNVLDVGGVMIFMGVVLLRNWVILLIGCMVVESLMCCVGGIVLDLLVCLRVGFCVC